MSSTCILSSRSTTAAVIKSKSVSKKSSIKSNTSSSSSASTNATPESYTKPIIHPALRPSTMQEQQQQERQATSATNFGEANSYQSANEVLHDTLTLLSGNNGPVRVILSVFRTTVDHFALIYPDNRRKAVAIKPAGCINLRGVTCEETTLGAGLRGFTLRPKKCDTSFAAVTFICSDVSIIPKWINALSPPSSPGDSPPSVAKNGSMHQQQYNKSPKTHFTTGGDDDESGSSYYRRNSPRLSSLSSLDEEDEDEYDE